MTIYEHKTSITVSGGTASTTSLKIRGGLLRHVLVRAGTDTTQFKVSLTNDNGTDIVDYGFHTCELNDWDMTVPVQGAYTLTVKNASATDNFTVLMAVQE